jgi:hypothetical protein
MAGNGTIGGTFKPRIRMLLPLWGLAYFNKWFDVPAASLFSDGNIPYLQEHSNFELIFLTKLDDIQFLQRHPDFQRLQQQITARTLTIDEFFPTKANVPYGVPLTLAYAKGVQDLGEGGIGTFVILMNADFVLSDGSLRTLLDRIQQGFHIVTAPSIRVVDHLARPQLKSLINKRPRQKGIFAREAMKIVNENLHQTVLTRVINRPELIEAWWYHQVYWRIDPSCLAARYFLLMPLCFQLRRQIQTVTCPIDYGFFELVCPGGRYSVLRDSDDFLMVELQEQDSEAELLRPAQKFASREKAIESKISDIVANAGVWATAEHRRAVTHTLLFHSEDLPATIEEQLSEFDQHMARMLNDMPPPLPVSRHFHWLAALHDYRLRMFRDGVMQCPDLVLHDLNRAYRPLLRQSPVEENRAPSSLTNDENDAAVSYLREASIILTIDSLMSEIATLTRSTQVFTIRSDEIYSDDKEIQFVLPTWGDLSAGMKLGVYIVCDAIPHLSKLSFIFSKVLDSGGDIVIFVRGTEAEKYFSLSWPENCWWLSRLQYLFPSTLYRAEIELLPAATWNPPESPLSQLLSDLHGMGHEGPRLGFVIRLSVPE